MPHGIAYAIEDSFLGIRIALALGFRWIDLDCHVTKDGVWVVGHWAAITKDHFLLPPWFVEKYGHNPKIRQVLWADLQQLRTKPLLWRGRRYRVHYISVEQAMRRASRSKRLGLALEMKGDVAFEKAETHATLERVRARTGLPNARLMVMTLSDIGHPQRRLAPAKAAGRTTVLQTRGPVPRSWEPSIDYIRGRWVRVSG